jgi:hypothetical protein
MRDELGKRCYHCGEVANENSSEACRNDINSDIECIRFSIGPMTKQSKVIHAEMYSGTFGRIKIKMQLF